MTEQPEIEEVSALDELDENPDECVGELVEDPFDIVVDEEDSDV